MEDPIAKLLWALRGVGILGTNHPNVPENLLITGFTGLNDQPTHRVHNDCSSTTIYPTRQRLDA